MATFDAPSSVEPTTEMLLAFMLEDAKAVLAQQDGRGDAGGSDDVAAYRALSEELERALQIRADHRLAMSMDAAEDDVESVQENDQNTTLSDTHIPANEDGDESVEAGAQTSKGHLTLDSLTMALAEIELNVAAGKDGHCKNGSHGDFLASIVCVSCDASHPAIWSAKAPCGHDYCSACVARLFKLATKDEELFPPRCCRQDFIFEAVKGHLNAALAQLYRAKAIEFTTPKRVYCSSSTCSAFIPPTSIHKAHAHCTVCDTITCVYCKHKSHLGQCEEDPDVKLLEDLSRESGWQKCGKCGRIVELVHGCNHMSCPCGHHFCYLCGQQWKSCDCSQWDEARLLEQARVIAARQNNDLPAGAAALRVVAEHIRQNHECEHRRFRYTELNRRSTCEHCSQRYYKFLWTCQQCELRFCAECRYNRL